MILANTAVMKTLIPEKQIFMNSLLLFDLLVYISIQGLTNVLKDQFTLFKIKI